MDTDYVVTWFIGVGAAMQIAVHLFAYRFRYPSNLAVSGLVLSVVVLGSLAQIPHAGYLALGIWVMLSLAPSLANKRAARLAAAQRFVEAAFMAKIAGFLHPFGGNRDHSRYLLALACADADDLEGARRQLRLLRESRSLHTLAEFERLRLESSYAAIVARGRTLTLTTDTTNATPIFMRALGELGMVEELLETYARLPQPLQHVANIQIICAAYAGRPDWVALLLKGPLSELPARIASYWMATAEQSAGLATDARTRLEVLESERGIVGRQARYRLAHPLNEIDRDALGETARAILQRMEMQLRHVQLMGHTKPRRRPVATFALVAVQGGVFLFELRGGSTNPHNLVDMGALVLPPEVVGNDVAWRAVAAGFLHFGATHLFLNLAGIGLVGASVERLWGGSKMLFVFLSSSIGAFAIAPQIVSGPRIVVGASAGVLGLVGALSTFIAVGYFYGRNKALRDRLLVIVLVLMVQVAFDLSTPIVASSLHILGFVFGVVASTPFAFTQWRHARASHEAA